MSRRGPEARPNDRDEEALQWVVRLTSGLATDEQLEAFKRWRDAHPENAAALAQARHLWTSVGEALVAGQERQVADSMRAPPTAGRHPAWTRSLARSPAAWLRRHKRAAISLATAACAVFLVLQWPFADVKSGSSIRTVTLADGSVATLTPGTAMDVSFDSKGERHVALKQGEAFFDVRHDPSRPFVVNSGQGTTRVLGTAFSVRQVGGMTRVIVIRGRVEVASGAERRILSPDREVVYGLTTMGQIRAVDAAQDLSWTRGRLIFDNQTLGDVIAELDLFDPRKIVLLNRKASATRVNAVIDLKRADQWLNALEGSEHLSVTRVAGMVIIH